MGWVGLPMKEDVVLSLQDESRAVKDETFWKPLIRVLLNCWHTTTQHVDGLK